MMFTLVTITIVLAVVVSIIGLLLIAYLIDINYIIRIVIGYLYVTVRRRKRGFTNESEFVGIVLPFDADIQFTHMNNARVLREYDFGRVYFWTECRLLHYHMKKFGVWHPVFAVASTIRYRRPLHMFSVYKVVTKAIYWEENIIYHEQKMITPKDGIIRNVGYSKTIFPFNIDDWVRERYPDTVKPELPEDLDLWIRYNDMNGKLSKRPTSRNETNEAST